jgi:hypothetical protein
MKNVLFNNHLMNGKMADKKALIGLDEHTLSYDYQFSQSTTKRMAQYSKLYDESCKPFKLIPFDYKGVKFNLITCPTGIVTIIVDLEPDDEDRMEFCNGKSYKDLMDSQYLTRQDKEIEKPFMLGETEVTQELFLAVMGFNYSTFNKSNKNPVSNVNWYDCAEFCNRLSDYFGFGNCYMLSNKEFSNKNNPLSIQRATVTIVERVNGFRLPREWEWQLAAMAGTENIHPGVDKKIDLTKNAWFADNSGDETHPVAQKLPNEWGFYDMSGNVLEWCENYKIDKLGGEQYILRGGSCYRNLMYVSSLVRYSFFPGDRRETFGFRICRTII